MLTRNNIPSSSSITWQRKEGRKQGNVRDDYYGAQRHCQGRPATEPASCQRSLSLLPEHRPPATGAGRSAWNQLPHWLLPTVQWPFSGPVPWFRCLRVTRRTFFFFFFLQGSSMEPPHCNYSAPHSYVVPRYTLELLPTLPTRRHLRTRPHHPPLRINHGRSRPGTGPDRPASTAASCSSKQNAFVIVVVMGGEAVDADDAASAQRAKPPAGSVAVSSVKLLT